MSKAKQKKTAPGRTLSQEERRAVGAKVIVSIALTPEALTAIDRFRGPEARGAFLERLVKTELARGQVSR